MLLNETQRAFSDPAWAFEIKFDGYRALGEWSPAGARLQSREGNDMSRWFGEVTAALASIGSKRRCIVDGEICVLNEMGIAGDAEFRRLFKRQARRGFKAGDDPVIFCVFDALVVNGRNVMHLPLSERKRHVAKLLAGVPHTRVISKILENGQGLFQTALDLKLEGLVAKRLAAPYQSGVRPRDWLKIKRPASVPAERFRHRRIRQGGPCPAPARLRGRLLPLCHRRGDAWPRLHPQTLPDHRTLPGPRVEAPRGFSAHTFHRATGRGS